MRALTALLAFTTLAGPMAAQAAPEQEMVKLVQAFLARSLTNDWGDLSKLPGITWAPAPQNLQNCLPDGGCTARQGRGTIAGRNLAVIASGARSMWNYIYLRNGSTPFGEPKLLAALTGAELDPQLARCPIPGKGGGTNWYRLRNAALNPGVLSIQTTCNGRPCEGFVLSVGEELPALQTNQVALYSEQCEPGAERIAVSNLKPHERLAEITVMLLAPASGPVLYDWKTLMGLATDITWNWEAPRPMDMSTTWNDTSPLGLTGNATWGGRKFSVIAAGTEAQVKAVYFDEQGQHARGEHMLGVVYERGIAVRLVRCGPVYSGSTNNWYSLQSARTRPAMIRQSIRYDGNQVNDSYAIRLDGTMPTRDPRDRNPGVNGCQ